MHKDELHSLTMHHALMSGSDNGEEAKRVEHEVTDEEARERRGLFAIIWGGRSGE